MVGGSSRDPSASPCGRHHVLSGHRSSDRYRVAATARRTALTEMSTSVSVVDAFDSETRSSR